MISDTRKYSPQGARYMLELFRLENVGENEALLRIARYHSREEEMKQALKDRPGGLWNVFRKHGEASEELMDRVCRPESALEQELTLDEKPAENGKRKKPDNWIKSWSKVKDGRVMASMGDLYANFKIIKKMREQGTAEEQAKAQLYLNSLREDFVWHGAEGGLVADTRFFYSGNSLDARVVQHYKCPRPELTKEKVIEVPIFRSTLVEEVTQNHSGLTYLQTVLDTEDDAEAIIQTLEFIGGKKRKEIKSWTAGWSKDSESEALKERAKYPERAVWLGVDAGGLALYCSYGPIDGSGRLRGVRRLVTAAGDAQKKGK